MAAPDWFSYNISSPEELEFMKDELESFQTTLTNILSGVKTLIDTVTPLLIGKNLFLRLDQHSETGSPIPYCTRLGHRSA